MDRFTENKPSGKPSQITTRNECSATFDHFGRSLTYVRLPNGELARVVGHWEMYLQIETATRVQWVEAGICSPATVPIS